MNQLALCFPKVLLRQLDLSALAYPSVQSNQLLQMGLSRPAARLLPMGLWDLLILLVLFLQSVPLLPFHRPDLVVLLSRIPLVVLEVPEHQMVPEVQQALLPLLGLLVQ